jgi:hypothetical protein
LIMESAIMSLLMLWAILYFRINAKWYLGIKN